MAQVRVTIKTTEVKVMEVGDLPVNLIRDLLQKRGDGTFDGNWTPSDVQGQSDYSFDSIEVEELPKGRS